jgi:crotonobetainyl-CoA:carnitine CoA-transferase CaiB-like acyl-CoA transferase
MLASVPHEDRDDYVTPALPIRMAGERLDPRSAPPALGDRGREALLQAGFSPDEVDALVDAGTVRVRGESA